MSKMFTIGLLAAVLGLMANISVSHASENTTTFNQQSDRNYYCGGYCGGRSNGRGGYCYDYNNQ